MASSPHVQDFPLLIDVFREGLKLGLISKDEVVAWADTIISNTDEPDYFFIEVSLSHDVNGLLVVLNNYVTPTDNPICNRVLLALIYHREPIGDVEQVEKMATLVGGLSSWDRLTSFENNTLYEFEDYYLYYYTDLTLLQVDLINFLGIYKAFTLENFKEWYGINEQVLELLKEEEVKLKILNKANSKAWAKREKKRKLKLYLKKTGHIVLLLIFFSLMIALFDDGKTNHFMLYFMICYFCLRLAYEWRKGRKKLS